MALNGRHHAAGHALLHSHFVLLAVLATLALPCALQPVFAHLAPEHNCVHDSLKQVHRTSPQQYRDPGWDALPGGGRIRRRRLAQEEWGQLRIATYYNLDGTNPVKEAYVRDSVVPQAVQLLEAALRVDSVVGNLFAARPCYSYWTASGTCYSFQDPPYCGHTQLPESHIGDTTYCLDGPASGCSTEPAGGDGVPDADFLVYVTVQQTTTCGTNTLACTLLLGEEIGGVPLQSFGLCAFITALTLCLLQTQHHVPRISLTARRTPTSTSALIYLTPTLKTCRHLSTPRVMRLSTAWGSARHTTPFSATPTATRSLRATPLGILHRRRFTAATHTRCPIPMSYRRSRSEGTRRGNS